VAKPFHETRLGALEAMRFLHPLRRFRGELPQARVKLLSFDRFRTGGLIGKVLRLAGLEERRLLKRAGTRKHANASPPAADVMFGAYLSAAFRNRELTPLGIEALGKVREGGAAMPLDGLQVRFLSPRLKREARELYRQDLPVLRQEFNLFADDPGPVTHDDLSCAHALSREQFETLLAAAAPFLPPEVRAAPRATYDLAIQRLG